MKTIRIYLFAALALAAGLPGCRQRTGTGAAGARHLSATQIADRAKPATVLVIAEYEADIDVPEMAIDGQQVVRDVQARRGDLPQLAEQERTRVLIEALLGEPERYWRPSANVRSKKKRVSGTGSGAIITPDGYVVTNAHVVELSPDEVKKAMLASFMELVESDVSRAEQLVASSLRGASLNDDARNRLSNALLEVYAQNSKLNGMKRELSVVLGYTRKGGEVEVGGARCEVVRSGKPIPGKDVALIKVNGASDLPTLPMAASLADAHIRTGSELFVIGYPGALSVVPDFTLPSRLDASQTSGRVSAIRDMVDNWQVLQTDTAIVPGNSGGPALDDTGEIVGLATFNVADPKTHNPLAGINFAVSVDVVQELLREAGVRPAESTFTRRYNEALDLYDAQQNRRALSIFTDLARQHPELPTLQSFIRELGGNGNARPGPSNAGTESSRTDVNQAPPETPRAGRARPVLFLIFIAGALAVIVAIAVLANRK